MTRVTSKLQVTIPRAIADRYGIQPGQDVDWLPAGDAIRVVAQSGRERSASPTRRLELFDSATQRQQERAGGVATTKTGRGWRREELYDRGRAR